MKITLEPRQQEFLDELIRTGRFADADQVVNEAIEMWRENESLDGWNIDTLRKEIESGVEQLNRGEGTPLDMNQIIAEGERRLAERENRGRCGA